MPLALTTKLSSTFKTWVRYLLITGLVTLIALGIYNYFAPFNGINPHRIADLLFYPAQYLSIILIIISLIIFSITDQRHQSFLLKLGLVPVFYGLGAFLLKGNIQDFSWFLLFAVLLQALNLFIIFSHHRPIGKSLLITLIFLFVALFNTALLANLPTQKSRPAKQNTVATTPIPTPTPYPRQDYSQSSIAPKSGNRAWIQLSHYQHTDPPTLSPHQFLQLSFSDKKDQSTQQFEYPYLASTIPSFAWNPAGTTFAVYDSAVIRIYTMTATGDSKANKKNDITISEIPVTDVLQLVFAGDNQTLYYVRSLALDNEAIEYQLIALNTVTHQQTTLSQSPNYLELYPLPNRLGYATTKKIAQYTYQVQIVTPTFTKTFAPIFESDYIFDIFLSPSLQSFCLNSGSSGSRWYSLVSNNQIIKQGDGDCKAWIDDQTILLDESGGVEAIYRLSTKTYLYQGGVESR